MYTPEEEYIPTENEAHGASPPLSRVLVEIPYSRPIESSHNRPQVQVAETSTGLAATLMSQFRASRIEWDDGMHTQYAIVVESGKDQAAFCPPRVILAGTEKQANLALEANRLARDIAEKTRDMVIAQKSAPLWNETPGHGWRGTREQIRAVGLKAHIALAEAELNNITNLAEGEGALVLPRKQAAEVARRVDLLQARGETVTSAVFDKIVSRVQKAFAPPARRHTGDAELKPKPLDKPRTSVSFDFILSFAFQPVLAPAYASARSFGSGRLAAYAAGAIVLPLVLVECGGGRAIVPTPGPEMIQRSGNGYDMALAHNIAIGTTLSPFERQANPAMQQLLDSLAAHNRSQGIPLTDKAEIVTMKGTGTEAFASQFAVTPNPKSEIKADKTTLPVNVAVIGPDGNATVTQGVYQVGAKDGITIASVSLLEKTDTGYKVGKVLYRTDLDAKGNITIYVADTKGTTPRYMKLTGTVDPNLGQKEALESFLQAIGFLPSAKVFAAEATSQSPTATPKVETPTSKPATATARPTDIPPTNAPESTKQVEAAPANCLNPADAQKVAADRLAQVSKERGKPVTLENLVAEHEAKFGKMKVTMIADVGSWYAFRAIITNPMVLGYYEMKTDAGAGTCLVIAYPDSQGKTKLTSSLVAVSVKNDWWRIPSLNVDKFPVKDAQTFIQKDRFMKWLDFAVKNGGGFKSIGIDLALEEKHINARFSRETPYVKPSLLKLFLSPKDYYVARFAIDRKNWGPISPSVPDLAELMKFLWQQVNDGKIKNEPGLIVEGIEVNESP